MTTGFVGWRRSAGLGILFLLMTGIGSAAPLLLLNSFTGTLASPESELLITVTLGVSSPITLQTYGFGGGVNGASQAISPGGFDPFVGVFSGTGGAAEFLMGFSDNLSNYSSATGCPPAGEITIGSGPGSVPNQCGDVGFSTGTLGAGTYTILLTDALYTPLAVFDPGPDPTLGEGFQDLSTGAFVTCYSDTECNNDTGNYALDIGLPDESNIVDVSLMQTPEPTTAFLCGLGVALIGWMGSRRRKRLVERPKIRI